MNSASPNQNDFNAADRERPIVGDALGTRLDGCRRSKNGSTRTAFAFSVLLVACLGPYWLGSHRPEEKAHPEGVGIGGLTVSPAHLNVGQVWEEDLLVWTLPIRNTTRAAIAIQRFTVSCQCLKVEPPALIVPAGQMASVKVMLDLARRSEGQIGLAERPFAFDVVPVLKNRAVPHGLAWTIHGKARSRVTLDALAVDFGEAPIHGQPADSRQVEAVLHVPARALEASVDPKVAAVTVARPTAQPGRYRLFIRPNPNLPTGPFAAQVKLQVITDAGARLPGPTLSFAGMMQSEVRLVPARLLLGPQRVGEVATALVVVQAPSGMALALEHIESASPDVEVRPTVADGGSTSHAYQVCQRVTQPGDSSTTVRFVFRGPGGARFRSALQVCCFGEAGAQRATAQAAGGVK